MSRVLVPDYFEQFHCKCGDCRHPCCDGWGINVSRREYYRLLGLECSRRLRHKLDDAFVLNNYPSDETFASIRPNYVGQCPMLDDDGLCLLQKERGEEMIPLVCRLYPRAIKKYGDTHEICMSASCEATVELLISGCEPLTLHETQTDLVFDGLGSAVDVPENDRLRRDCITLIGDTQKPLAERLRRIGQLCCTEEPGEAAPQADALPALCDVLAHLSHRSGSLAEIGQRTWDYLNTPDPAEMCRRFNAAAAHLDALLPHPDVTAARILANHMMYEGFPFGADCADTDAAFAAFMTAAALLRLLCVCCMAESDDLTAFADVVADANRFFEHSDYYRVFSRPEHPHGMAVYARFASLL